MLLGIVLDATLVKITVVPSLIDGIDWADTEGDGWELPEVIYLAWMGVGGEAADRLSGAIPAERWESKSASVKRPSRKARA